MELDADWAFVADTVMGGVSTGEVTRGEVAGRRAARLTGEVSLENDGGFVQMAFDPGQGPGLLDASDWTGIELEVIGNGEGYDLRLRTDALRRPWQSFVAPFVAAPDWTTVRLPFAEFAPNKTDATLDPARLRRIGLVAGGRAFRADVAVSAIRLYRDPQAGGPAG